MKTTVVICLIMVGVGAVLFVIGLPTANTDFTLCGVGTAVYCIGSFVSGFASSATIRGFFGWGASNGTTGCLLFPFYIIVFPLLGMFLCVFGWIVALIALINNR